LNEITLTCGRPLSFNKDKKVILEDGRKVVCRVDSWLDH